MKSLDAGALVLRRPAPAARSARPRSSRAALAALTLAVALALTATSVARGWPLRPGAPAVPPPQVREFTLTASEIDWELMPGVTVRAWAYNGQVPGPELRVREGDTVRVTLINNLPVGTTIHWHGIDNRPEMDGPTGLNQAAVEPGETFVYEFIADPAGSRMYHSHADVAVQIALGLYGPLVVESREPTQTYDREYTYMLSEWDLELTPDVATGKAPRGPRDSQLRGGELGADLFLINGHAHEAIPPIAIAEGERVLIRLMNMGHLSHPIHTHGHSFKIVATDGNPVPEAAQLTKDTILIGPGERYDLELIGDNPGIWMLHCHIESHAANGMMTLIAYEGEVPTGPLADFWGSPLLGGASADMGNMHAGHTTPEAAATTTPAETPVAGAVLPADAVEVTLLDDRFVPPRLEIPAGTTVVWVNRGGNWHSVAAFDGTFNSGRLAVGESYAFTFETPGTYRYICQHHARQGMTGVIVVT